jgi:ATP-dependent Clp protease ATP-binding subunit ClpA
MAGFKKATKAQAKLRAAIFGPSGAGKTFTSLRVATGLAGDAGRIAVIDTERGSASKYSDRFAFDVLELEDQTIQGYVDAIRLAADEGYAVLVIDSLSHGWQTLLEEVEKLAKAKYRGNTWSAWSEGTPLQRKLVQAILTFPGHVLATMRSKTEWTTVDDGRGKKSPQRVGLAPEQGKGVEYEFDLLVEISTEHIANVIKDRTGKFQDKLLDKPDERFGRELAAWLADGEPAKPSVVVKAPPPAQAKPAAVDELPLYERISAYIAQAADVRTLGKMADRIDTLASDGELDADQADALRAAIGKRHDAIEPQGAAT